MTINPSGFPIPGSQLLLIAITICGFWFQNWQSNKRSKATKDDADSRQRLVEKQIELAAAQLALEAQRTHSETTAGLVAVGVDARRAYHEANSVNEKIRVVGAGTLKIAEALKDVQDVAGLTSDLQDAKDRTDKANGHDLEQEG